MALSRSTAACSRHGEPIRVKQGERVLVPYPEWKRDRDSQPCLARPFVPRGRARRKSRAESGHGSGALARHRGARFGHRRDESSGCLDHGRFGRMTIAATAWASSSSTPVQGQRAMDRARSPSLELRCIFAKPGANSRSPDETFEMMFAKDNAAEARIQSMDDQRRCLSDEQRNGHRFLSPESKANAIASACAMPVMTFIRSISTATASNSLRSRESRRPESSKMWSCWEAIKRPKSTSLRTIRADALPLPPAAAHGLRVHDPVRLRVTSHPYAEPATQRRRLLMEATTFVESSWRFR